MKVKFIVLLISSVYITSCCFSQQIIKSKEIKKINGKEYYIHTVQKKETVWKISKVYDVSPEEIFEANPGSQLKIKADDLLKIPVKKSANNQIGTGKTDIKKAAETFEHTVVSGENLSAIAKKYSVTVENILKANPGLKTKIKPGQIIKIPGKIKNENTLSKKDTLAVNADTFSIDCTNPKLLNSYNIALFIPFYTDNINQIQTDITDIREKDQDDFRSFTFIQFYEGVLLAIDSLKRKGFSAKVYVYDADEDSSKTARLLNKPELTKMHLIIGPFFEESFKVVSEFAKKHKIIIVDPVSAGDALIKDNPVVFKATPSVNMQLKQLAVYIAEKYSSSPVIIVHNNKDNEKEHLAVFENALNTELKKAGRKDSSYFKVIYNQEGFSGITENFSSSDTNIIVTLCNGEIFVTNYMSNFNKIYDKYKMIVFGLPSWKNFDNIETEYMQNINLHLFSSSFIDYSDENVKDFIVKYREQYKTEPAKYAFQGFDIAMFFLQSLKKFGARFENCIGNVSNTYLQSNYKFVKNKENDGYENIYLNIYRYEDYEFINSRLHPKIKEKEKKKQHPQK